MTNPKWLELAARRSVEHTWTLGYVFEQYQKREGKTREQIAAALGCSLDDLNWLSVCRCPDKERFEEQLGQIKERFNLDTDQLAAIIQRVRLLVTFSKSRSGEGFAGEGPVLLAARDHSSDEDVDEDEYEDETNT